MLDHAQLLGIVLCILAVPFVFQSPMSCEGSECWASDSTEPTPSPEEMADLAADMNRTFQRHTMAFRIGAASLGAAGIMAFRHAAPATVATLTGIGGVALAFATAM